MRRVACASLSLSPRIAWAGVTVSSVHLVRCPVLRRRSGEHASNQIVSLDSESEGGVSRRMLEDSGRSTANERGKIVSYGHIDRLDPVQLTPPRLATVRLFFCSRQSQWFTEFNVQCRNSLEIDRVANRNFWQATVPHTICLGPGVGLHMKRLLPHWK